MICKNSLEIPKGPGIYGFFFKNGKKYIGKASKIRARYIKYKSCLNTGKYYRHNFCAILKREGLDNVEFRAIELCNGMTNDEILKREAGWIKYYDSTNPERGYNICKFSNDATGVKQSEEHRLKNSGKNSVHYGKTRTLEHRAIISKTHKGIPESEETIAKLIKIRNTPEYKEKRSKNSKAIMRRPEVIAKIKIGRAKQDMSHLHKPVKQIDKETGKILNIFKSLSHAAQSLNKNNKAGDLISRVCKKEKWLKSAYGFKWEYSTKEELFQFNQQ